MIHVGLAWGRTKYNVFLKRDTAVYYNILSSSGDIQ